MIEKTQRGILELVFKRLRALKKHTAQCAGDANAEGAIDRIESSLERCYGPMWRHYYAEPDYRRQAEAA